MGRGAKKVKNHWRRI